MQFKHKSEKHRDWNRGDLRYWRDTLAKKTPANLIEEFRLRFALQNHIFNISPLAETSLKTFLPDLLCVYTTECHGAKAAERPPVPQGLRAGS